MLDFIAWGSTIGQRYWKLVSEAQERPAGTIHLTKTQGQMVEGCRDCSTTSRMEIDGAESPDIGDRLNTSVRAFVGFHAGSFSNRRKSASPVIVPCLPDFGRLRILP